MIFTETPLPGAYLIDLEPYSDERGFFARTYCQREFEAHGLTAEVVQCNTSFNAGKGTIRGLHYQTPPAAEAKLVRCIRGAIFDVIVDLRADSATFGRHFSVELTADNRRALFVPEAFAHGFQTLLHETEVHYQMSAFYDPESAAGFPYNDPKLKIGWPLPVTAISEQDRNWPAFS